MAGGSVYTPHQHVARPIGQARPTIYAMVEVCADEPPDAIVIGPWRYVREAADDDEEGGGEDGEG